MHQFAKELDASCIKIERVIGAGESSFSLKHTHTHGGTVPCMFITMMAKYLFLQQPSLHFSVLIINSPFVGRECYRAVGEIVA